jgi:protein TonB
MELPYRCPPVLERSPVIPFVAGFSLSLTAFIMLPLSQMISLELVPQTPAIQADIEQPIPEPYTPPPPEPPDTKEIEVKELLEELKPPTINQLETSMNVDLSGIATAGIIYDPRMLGNEILDEIHRISDLTVVPVATQRIPPIYPSDLKRNRIEGTVVVEFVVRPNGKTDLIRIVKSTNHGFNDATVHALRKWVFKPGEKDGRAVSSRMRITIPFRISSGD